MACQNCGFFGVVYNRDTNLWVIELKGVGDWSLEINYCPKCGKKLKLSDEFVHHIKQKEMEAK